VYLVSGCASESTGRTVDRFSSIPDELKGLKNWVVWKPVLLDNGKWSKVPFQPRDPGAPASSNDPGTWGSYEEVVEVESSSPGFGIGFVLTGTDVVGIDLDGCFLQDGSLAAWAVSLLDLAAKCGAYIERSPSGNGLHVIGRGAGPKPAKEKFVTEHGAVEVFRKATRYLTFTGEKVGDSTRSELANIDAIVDEIIAGYGEVEHGDEFDEAGCRSDDQSDRVRSALRVISPDDRDNWLKVGMALHTDAQLLGGSAAAYEIWTEWSRSSVKFDERDQRKTWEGFPRRVGPKVHLGTVFYRAKQNGWVSPPKTRTRTAKAANDDQVDLGVEDAIALAFAEKYQGDLRYVAGFGKWMAFDGMRWSADSTLATFDKVRELCRAMHSASAKTVSAVTSLARADRRLAATVEQWDADQWLLNTPAGTVDLRTGATRPHDPRDYVTKIAAVSPSGDYPLWKQFLDRVTGGDRQLVDFLQRMSGYALTGSTVEHALFFLYGTGANGKSVFMSTVAGILADYQRTAPIETFTATTGGDRHPTDLAGLRGARLVTATETEEGRRWAESRIKTLTGGDPVSARFMRQDFFDFTPQFKLVISGNHKPGLRSVNEAIRRRFHLIPFTVTIPKEERDPDLTEKLKAEWPGILQWMIEGCLQWQESGLAAPAAVTEATKSYLESEDAIGNWIEDCCSQDAQAETLLKRLFESYKSWAEANEEFVISNKKFASALEDRGVKSRKTERGKAVRGLGLVGGDGSFGQFR